MEARGLRALISAIGSVGRRHSGQGDHATRGRLETSRIFVRRRYLDELDRLLNDWPHAFRSLSREAPLSRSDFTETERLPFWLADEVKQLHCGPKRRRVKMPSLWNRIVDIQHERSPNWRARRAALMIKAAI